MRSLSLSLSARLTGLLETVMAYLSVALFLAGTDEQY